MNFKKLNDQIIDPIEKRKIIFLALLLIFSLSILIFQLLDIYNYLRQKEDAIELLEQQQEELMGQLIDNEQILSDLETELDKTKEELRNIEEKNPFLLNYDADVIMKGRFVATAYDLSVQSTGKPIGHFQYGITRSGYDLSGHTWYTARTIAVDPRVIPLGSQVMLHFKDEAYHKYNGIYTARDTGGAIKQNKIDFFMGDFQQNAAHPKAMRFGVTEVYVALIQEL